MLDDLIAQLKALHLYGMAQALADLAATPGAFHFFELECERAIEISTTMSQYLRYIVLLPLGA